MQNAERYVEWGMYVYNNICIGRAVYRIGHVQSKIRYRAKCVVSLCWVCFGLCCSIVCVCVYVLYWFLFCVVWYIPYKKRRAPVYDSLRGTGVLHM